MALKHVEDVRAGDAVFSRGEWRSVIKVGSFGTGVRLEFTNHTAANYSAGSTLAVRDSVALRAEIIEAMTGNAVYVEENANEALDAYVRSLSREVVQGLVVEFEQGES